jgi:hypothetical protein
MARTDKKVWYTPKSKLPAAPVGPASDSGSSAADVEKAIKTIEGRWKMVILSHLFARPVMRFSELERAIPGVSQKMLVQQLREPDRRPHGAPSGAPEGRVSADRTRPGALSGAQAAARLGDRAKAMAGSGGER